MNCKNCGKEVPQTKGKRKREFCDNKGLCRTAFWKKQNPSVHRSILIELPADYQNIKNISILKPDGTTQKIDFKKLQKDAPKWAKYFSFIDASVWETTYGGMKPIKISERTIKAEKSETLELPVGNRIEIKADVIENNPETRNSILNQIIALKAEKCPKERDTPMGRKVWDIERNKKIADLQKQLASH